LKGNQLAIMLVICLSALGFPIKSYDIDSLEEPLIVSNWNLSPSSKANKNIGFMSQNKKFKVS
jgi:hypothetical protein